MLRDPLLQYRHVRRWRRATLALFFIAFVATVLWAIPWVPYGLSVEDYNERLTFLILLILGACACALGAVYFRTTSERLELAIATWAMLNEGLGDMRRREYFFDRLVTECNLKDGRGQFTVVTLRLEEPGEVAAQEAKIASAINALEPLVREQDCLAALGPHEIGVLAPRVSAEEAPKFAERLRALVQQASAGRELRVEAAWAVYPSDADEAGALVGTARKRLIASVRRPPAAASEGAAGNEAA